MEEQQPEQPALSPEEFVASVTGSDNIAAMMDDGQLNAIAHDVAQDHETDSDSMKDWLDRMKKGIDLAKLVKEDKSYPFKNASNIKYPLITSAAMQFNARAYPAIVAPDRVVKCKTWGADPQGLKAARADRVSEYTSYQLSSEIEEWEEETDKLLLQLPIVGTMVRKVWFDPVHGRARCKLIEPGNFIVNDKVKVLNEAPRCGEILPLYPYEIRERVEAGLFLDIDLEDTDDDAQKLQEFVEQHTRLDLDEDGYPEPYIVTFHCKTRKIVRIVADFEPEDVKYKTRQKMQMVPVQDQWGGIMDVPQPVEVKTGVLAIRRNHYFVAYQFIPGLEGGFWGTGLGMLLADISASVNSILNMLIDAGHMASRGGGFIGSELRLKGGRQQFEPGEWKMLPASGADIRSAIAPMTFPGPDGTLFQMLGMLIDAGREIASVQDVMTGDAGGRQQTATTTIALIEQGLAVFTAVYKRIFRAMKHEFKLLAQINAVTVNAEKYNAFHDGQEMYDPAQDYALADMDICPVADPQMVTKMQAMAVAQFLMELAQAGLVDAGEAAKRILEAANVDDTEALMPKPNPAQQAMEQMGMQAAQADLSMKLVDIDLKLMEIEKTKAEVVKIYGEAGAEAARVRLEAIGKALEATKLEIERAVSGRRGSVAGASGDAGNAGRAGAPVPGAEASGVAGLLVGQPVAPGAPAGVAPNGGMGGGYV